MACLLCLDEHSNIECMVIVGAGVAFIHSIHTCTAAPFIGSELSLQADILTNRA